MLCQLCEKATAKVASNHIKLNLTLLKLVNERFSLPSLLLKLSTFICQFLEFYKMIKIDKSYQVGISHIYACPHSQCSNHDRCGRT